jgi:hypothetical protein
MLRGVGFCVQEQSVRIARPRRNVRRFGIVLKIRRWIITFLCL